MISLKFPSLEKLLSKQTAELDEDDPKKGICIRDGHAIIVTEQFILFFDLADYFVKTNNFIDNNVLNEMQRILDFMEGKMFSSIFWKELTSINQVGISSEGINLNGAIQKDIYYREKIFDVSEITMLCTTIKGSEPFNKSMNAIYIEPLLNLLTGLKPMVKTDTLVLRTVGENTQIQFTFDESPWIYGVISANAATNSKFFVFDSLQMFAEEFLK